jgi:alkylated DNA nucleotide flippase Atl1
MHNASHVAGFSQGLQTAVLGILGATASFGDVAQAAGLEFPRDVGRILGSTRYWRRARLAAERAVSGAFTSIVIEIDSGD